MSFKNFVKQNISEAANHGLHTQFLTEIADPPMLIQLRRLGIRNYPNGQRVALFSNPQLQIELAIPYDYTTGKLLPSNQIPMKEESDPHEFFDKDEKVRLLNAAMQQHFSGDSELDSAISTWLEDEINEYGSFGDMDDDVLDDIFDDYNSLMSGAALSEDFKPKKVPRFGNNSIYVKMKQKQTAIKQNKPIEINNYADWYEHMEKKHGEGISFKLHNSGNTTSAYSSGKHVGSFQHNKKVGSTVSEEVLIETPMHQINAILKTGKESNVKFNNVAYAYIHPVTAKSVHELFHKVNSTNKYKLSELVNSSPEGLVKVAKFASSLMNKKGNE